MNAKKIMRSIAYMLLVILLCQGVSGCTTAGMKRKRFNMQPIYHVDGSGYTIGTWHDKFYLVFDDPETYYKSTFTRNVTFSSVQEMRDSLMYGTLTDDKKRAFVELIGADSKLQIFDLNKVYDAKLPDDTKVSFVAMTGTSYTIYLSFTRNIAKYATINYLDEDSYREAFVRGYRQTFGPDNMNLGRIKELGDNGKRALYRSGSSKVNIRYNVSRGEETVIVEKRYDISWQRATIDEKRDIPYAVYLYCTQGDIYYIVTLTQFTEVPTDEWLLQIGLEKYAE